MDKKKKKRISVIAATGLVSSQLRATEVSVTDRVLHLDDGSAYRLSSRARKSHQRWGNIIQHTGCKNMETRIHVSLGSTRATCDRNQMTRLHTVGNL